MNIYFVTSYTYSHSILNMILFNKNHIQFKLNRFQPTNSENKILSYTNKFELLYFCIKNYISRELLLPNLVLLAF